MKLRTYLHERAFAQGPGGVLELLKIIECEIRPSRYQIETLVADLDDAQYFVRFIDDWR
jgi:hypothetical protein